MQRKVYIIIRKERIGIFKKRYIACDYYYYTMLNTVKDRIAINNCLNVYEARNMILMNKRNTVDVLIAKGVH